MFENIQNSVWHAFDYISVETGRVEALKSKLKVGKKNDDLSQKEVYSDIKSY